MNKLLSKMFINGVILVSIAMIGVLNSRLTGEEAAKYISPAVLFWTNTVLLCLSSGFLTLKGFLSTAYAEHLAKADEPKQPAPADPAA